MWRSPRKYPGAVTFLCYVNDTVTSMDKDCKLILYADDSTILCLVTKIQSLSGLNLARFWKDVLSGW